MMEQTIKKIARRIIKNDKIEVCDYQYVLRNENEYVKACRLLHDTFLNPNNIDYLDDYNSFKKSLLANAGYIYMELLHGHMLNMMNKKMKLHLTEMKLPGFVVD